LPVVHYPVLGGSHLCVANHLTIEYTEFFVIFRN
jgi:hypothetical protein